MSADVPPDGPSQPIDTSAAPSPGIVFACFDPWGRQIVLTEHRWRQHILLGHPALFDAEEIARDVLASPWGVMYDAKYADRESFYGFGRLPAPHDHLWLKVCVGFRLTGEGAVLGNVITAYPTPKIKSGERIKWRR
jgi:hypothetical protein